MCADVDRNQEKTYLTHQPLSEMSNRRKLTLSQNYSGPFDLRDFGTRSGLAASGFAFVTQVVLSWGRKRNAVSALDRLGIGHEHYLHADGKPCNTASSI